MDEARCELSGWRWECPRCGNWNDEASPLEIAICGDCWTDVELIYDEQDEKST